MNCASARWFSFAFIVVMISPAPVRMAQAQAPAHMPKEMGIWEARRSTALLNVEPVDEHYRFSAESFEFEPQPTSPKKAREAVKIDLLTAPEVKATCNNSGCRITDESGRPFGKDTGLGKLFHLNWVNGTPSKPRGCIDVCLTGVNQYIDAFNWLRTYARDADSPLRTFPQRAAVWRALATKPTIPEKVNVQRLMAEDAIKENKPYEALNFYELGIQLYPTWPEGNFNAALIAAELKYYADAAEHMQAYLELVPDAPDAQAARDKMLVWKAKAAAQ